MAPIVVLGIRFPDFKGLSFRKVSVLHKNIHLYILYFFAMKNLQKICIHLKNFKLVKSKEKVCNKCLQSGDSWIHLRICQTCGEVNCCDSSKNKHATEHHHETGHPVVISAEPGERWAWCYVDKQILQDIDF